MQLFLDIVIFLCMAYFPLDLYIVQVKLVFLHLDNSRVYKQER